MGAFYFAARTNDLFFPPLDLAKTIVLDDPAEAQTYETNRKLPSWHHGPSLASVEFFRRALHEKGLRGQLGVGRLVNQPSIVFQTPAVFLDSVYTFRIQSPGIHGRGGAHGTPTVRSAQVNRPLCPPGLPGIVYNCPCIFSEARRYEILFKPYLSSPKPGHTTGGSGRGGARRDGGVGRRRARQDADGTVRPRDNRPSYPPDDRGKPPWACLWKHEQRKTTYKPMGGNKIRGLSAGRKALFVPGC